MKFYLFMKYWSLAWMSASIGAALGSLLNKDYGYTIFYVVTCALNHFCYNVCKALTSAFLDLESMASLGMSDSSATSVITRSANSAIFDIGF